jgi:hypothetical protein
MQQEQGYQLDKKQLLESVGPNRIHTDDVLESVCNESVWDILNPEMNQQKNNFPELTVEQVMLVSGKINLALKLYWLQQ